MSTPYTDTIDVTAVATPLSASRRVLRCTISCPPGNAGNVTFTDPEGNTAAWIPGEWHAFEAINLADLNVSGTAGDTVTIVGEG
jgi:hypothetical protein